MNLIYVKLPWNLNYIFTIFATEVHSQFGEKWDSAGKTGTVAGENWDIAGWSGTSGFATLQPTSIPKYRLEETWSVARLTTGGRFSWLFCSGGKKIPISPPPQYIRTESIFPCNWLLGRCTILSFLMSIKAVKYIDANISLPLNTSTKNSNGCWPEWGISWTDWQATHFL